SGCCSSSPWSPGGASTGCGSRCRRCSRRWIGFCAPDGSTSSTWNSLTLATASCARRRPARTLPPLVVDSHEIAYDLARQFAVAGASSGRRLYASANWRKLRREELGIYREAAGVYLCSAEDEQRLLDQIPE